MSLPFKIVDISKKLIKQLAPPIAEIIAKTGLKIPPSKSSDLDSSDNGEKYPSCLPKDELQKIAATRNNMVDQLNNFAKKIEAFSKFVTPITNVTNKLQSSVDKLKSVRKKVSLARKIGSIAVKAVPAPPGTPGAITSTLSDLAYIDSNSKEIIEDVLEPKLNIAKSKISGLLAALDYAKAVIANSSKSIKVIDNYLTNCGVSSLTPTSSYVNNVTAESEAQDIAQSTESETGVKETYNGFILEIIEEPFSPTVNRRKAVGKNANNIILLETPLSFTTNNQILINQIKLIIDSSDLKAY